MMASEFAKRLASQLPEAQFIGRSALKDYVPRELMIDAELQEVREVLDGLTGFQTATGPCWCGSNTKHTDVCQRARQLAERLRVG